MIIQTNKKHKPESQGKKARNRKWQFSSQGVEESNHIKIVNRDEANIFIWI